MKKVLLHICCANCATVCVERLRSQGLEVTGIFYNPNIHPQEEYQRRKDEFNKLAEKAGFKVIEAEYDYSRWFDAIQGHEADKEGGRRCGICFELRLKEVGRLAKAEGFDFFTTTLTISPHKNSSLINEIGCKLNKDKFLTGDFKKKGGFKQSVQRSKELGLYRQSYCGCTFSKK